MTVQILELRVLRHIHAFHVHTAYLDNYQSFFSPPTDAQLDVLKNNFKFALKLILKSSYMFRRETPSSGSMFIQLRTAAF